MGQTESYSSLPNAIASFQNTIIRQTKNLTEISSITYEQFNENLTELNSLATKCMDSEGKHLKFAVKKGSDSSILWKATIRIAVIKYDPKMQLVESCKFLNLSQFLKYFRTIKNEVMTALQINASELDQPEILFQRVTSAVDNENSCELSSECCICFERKQEITLPCTHSYCQLCIAIWNVNNNTCPVCREVMTKSDEEWILFDAPNSAEINEHIVTSLINISADLENGIL